MSPLNVYKASAGSGKTFALTMEYLGLLFRFPDIHRHILAVTFTNKAAGEMKQRILGRLYKLSRYDASQGLAEMTQLMNSTGLDEKEIKMRAGELLNTILNDYSAFSVGTIDKFFQSVIRAFTREIGIQPGYNLELDHHRVLSLAVDRLFRDISDQSELQQWLIRFAEERMEESRSWNFRNDIVQLGLQLFREAFQSLFLEQDLSVLEKENLDQYLSDLNQEEEKTRREIVGTGKSALDHMQQSGLEVRSFRLKDKSVPSLFHEASEDRDLTFTPARIEALDNLEKWLNKGASDEMIRLTENVLMPLLNKLYNQQVVLNTITAIRQNFYTLGILGDIWERVKAYTTERNLFLIADSSRFLRGIIGGNQVPFIYERTGNQYSHIMLDEFQDTSVFQYDNFKPLLDNALASGNDNLVVGDVKQSIYRWRNSDWEILSSDLETDFRHQEFRIHTLDKNYRSREQIIRFNNTVFQAAPQVLAQRIQEELSNFQDAYADAVQQIPEGSLGSGGMVRIELFGDREELSFQDRVLSRIPVWIEEIQQSGFEPGEIAILVRSRKEGVSVANTLLEHARSTGERHLFRLISNESLLLVHNTAVSLITAALRFMIYPGDDLNNALLKYQGFLAGILPDGETGRLFDTSLSMDQFLPPAFMDRIHSFKQLPLYELVETLIKVFGLEERIQDLPYLQALQDLIIDLHRGQPMGIVEFLNFWEENGSKQGVSISEASNAIRILTIHKAKGLEFKAVLVPFCNWEITTDQRKSNILWCETESTPFHRIPTVPVRFASNMQHTLFSEAYYQERMKGYMDSLNLMYVAFTRAIDALFIGIPDSEKASFRNTGDLLKATLNHECVVSPSLGSLEKYGTGEVIQVGSLPVYGKNPAGEDSWKFSSYPVNQRNRSLKVRLRSDEYFVDEDGTFRTGWSYGNMMHLVFSRISSLKDVDPLLKSLQKEGLLPGRDRAELKDKIENMITQPGVEQWFSGKENQTIHNERSILSGDGKVFRPDRVIVDGDHVTVVDFKFGSAEKNQYILQVRNYMRLLEQMGYGQTEGYVWYVILGKTVKVESQ